MGTMHYDIVCFFKSLKHTLTVQIDWKASWQKIWTAFWVTAVVVFVSESSTWSSKDISEGSMVGHNSHKTGQLHTAITGLYYHLLLLLRGPTHVQPNSSLLCVQQSQSSSIKIYQEIAANPVSHGQLIVVPHYLTDGGSCRTIKSWGQLQLYWPASSQRDGSQWWELLTGWPALWSQHWSNISQIITDGQQPGGETRKKYQTY